MRHILQITLSGIASFMKKGFRVGAFLVTDDFYYLVADEGSYLLTDGEISE